MQVWGYMNAENSKVQRMQSNLYGYSGITECPEYRTGIIRDLSRLWFPGPSCGPMEAARKRNENDTITSEGYKRLAIMVIVQAARDAYSGDMEAKTWLENIGPDWLDTLAFPVTSGFYRDWLAAGCPGVADGRGWRGVTDSKRGDPGKGRGG